MYTMQTTIFVLLAISLAQALPQPRVLQRDLTSTSPVLTFTSLIEGSWDLTSPTDPDWVFGEPQNTTLPDMNTRYLFDGLVLDDNHEPIENSRLWKANIPTGTFCNLTMTSGFQTILPAWDEEYRFTDDLYLLEVQEVFCQNATTLPHPVPEVANEKRQITEGPAGSEDGWELQGLQASTPPYTTISLKEFYWVPEPTPAV